jgi:broad specificity phosphatase PhoE
MRHLVFIRHGESQLNAISRQRRTYCGQIETPLTDRGREQARAAGQRLAALTYVQPRIAISSPLTRAVETLSLVLGELAAEVALHPPAKGLMERSHGQFEGIAEEDIFRDFPHYRDDPNYCRFMNHFEQCAPGGETLSMVSDRAWAAINEATAATTGDLVIVSHFNPIRCVVGRALDLPRAEVLKLHIPNAEPIVLGFNGSFRLLDSPDLYAGWNAAPDDNSASIEVERA